MHSVYLDESGHETGEHIVIAGFLGSDDQWEAFEHDWKTAIGSSKKFHIAKVRWGKDATRRRLARLAAIPYKHGLRAVLGACRVSDYADLIENTAEEYAVQGYPLVIFPIINEVLKAVPATEKIRWVFEEQHDYEQQARNVFRNFPIKDASRLSDVSFVSKDATVRTQVADYLAYAMLQLLRDPSSEKTEWCRPILGDNSFLGMNAGRDLIRSIVKNALEQAATLTHLQTGQNPKTAFGNFASKKEVHEAMKRAMERKKEHDNRVAVAATKINPYF
jgi:hypothetical protein